MASPLVSVVFVWKVTDEVVWCGAEQGGVQVDARFVYARHISHRNFRVRQKEKENRDFYFFRESQDEEVPSVVAPPSSVTAKKLGVCRLCFGGNCYWVAPRFH